MKFAHFADVHIGAWRDPKLADISTRAFLKALNICKDEKVDFILISGDFFNTSLPSIERLKEVVTALKDLKDSSIRVYIIAGSHDFSPTGKTMLDVLENAGLFVNVMRGEVINNRLRLRFTLDTTGAKITGIIGRKGMLEKIYYENLIKESLESEQGFKIFMFHTALTEFKPKEMEKMDSNPLSLLPRNFNYYAGGHVHYVFSRHEPGYGPINYPGPIFPNNFRELEKLKHGGFYIVTAEKDKADFRYIPIEIYSVTSFSFDCNHKSAASVEAEAIDAVKKAELNNSIVTLRFYGKLSSGTPSDINFKSIFDSCYFGNAYFVMKNSASLTSQEFEEIKTEDSSVDEIERSIIKEHAGQIKFGLSQGKEKELASNLLRALNTEKEEGETTATFETRLKDDISGILGIKLS